jgi:1-acyl-sn-glycerol-3-phosphate acyltransferase
MEELIGIYPEGQEVGKPFRERYRLLDFHPGFVQLAIETGTPHSCSTLGGDEIYPEFVNLKKLARFIGMPFYPLLFTFPWLPFLFI